MKRLSGERKLAVQAVLIALPEQGPPLVQTVALYDEDETVQATARSSLERAVNTLNRDLFSKDVGERTAAAQDLVQNWRNEPNVVPTLVNFAKQNMENSDGVYNTVVVLSEFPLRVLEVHKSEVLEFAELAKTIGPKTAARVAELAKRLGD